MSTNTPIEFAISQMSHKIGDDIYIQGAMYMSHGRDDFQGGLCKIKTIEYGCSGGKLVPFITIAERPGWKGNYCILLEKQQSLANLFGMNRGHCDPDERPEFNEA